MTASKLVLPLQATVLIDRIESLTAEACKSVVHPGSVSAADIMRTRGNVVAEDADRDVLAS